MKDYLLFTILIKFLGFYNLYEIVIIINKFINEYKYYL